MRLTLRVPLLSMTRIVVESSMMTRIVSASRSVPGSRAVPVGRGGGPRAETMTRIEERRALRRSSGVVAPRCASGLGGAGRGGAGRGWTGGGGARVARAALRLPRLPPSPKARPLPRPAPRCGAARRFRPGGSALRRLGPRAAAHRLGSRSAVQRPPPSISKPTYHYNTIITF
jgi:hypothetical protein